MKAFRYNSKRREDRKFNTSGKEKNPNRLSFYASNLDYVENYKYIYSEDGEVIYECVLEIVEIEGKNLFNMDSEFKTLTTYNNYIDGEIGSQKKDYTKFLNESKTKKEQKLWQKNIDELENREQELISILFNQEFQPLSDFERQNELVEELKLKGFEGYTTKNEIVIF